MKKTHFIKIFLLFPFLFYGQASVETTFLWKPAESNSQRFEKAVMLVPVKFQLDTTTYFLQFDTGATRSSLYSSRIKNSILGEGITKTSIGDIRFIENHSIKATDEKNAPVGTLGADFLKNRIVRINHREQTISFDASYASSDFYTQPMLVLDGRPLITAKIGGKNQQLLYDTGSSLFGIWTTKRNWNKLRDKKIAPSSFPVSSWGKVNDGFYSNLDKTIPLTFLGVNPEESINVWYVANRKFKRFFRKNKLYGIMGNEVFLEKEILLDFKTEVFGIEID